MHSWSFIRPRPHGRVQTGQCADVAGQGPRSPRI